MPSFDVVSQVEIQEVDNAVNQTISEIGNRYDFKGSKSTVEWKPKEKKIVIVAEDDYKLSAITDILQTKMVKRDVPLKNLKYGTIETAFGQQVRQEITIEEGISKENAKTVTKLIKESKKKVQAQIMDDMIRVTAKKIDDLQATIALLKSSNVEVSLQFINMRD